MSKHTGWIGVDLDGTLAHYDKWVSVEHIGAPIPPMVERVKTWLKQGREVRIFTARVYEGGGNNRDERYWQACRARSVIQAWCRLHLGQTLMVTCVKDFNMVELWDDRAVGVVANLGVEKRPATSWRQRLTCWFSKHFYDVHDYPDGHLGYPEHFENHCCTRCGTTFTI